MKSILKIVLLVFLSVFAHSNVMKIYIFYFIFSSYI